MYKKIYNKIKKYNNIVLVRHINVDPDAMASVMSLKKSIELTFKDKKVFAIGAGTIRFNYLGRLDKEVDGRVLGDTLLIVLDTPDYKRADFDEFSDYQYSIKIDHHPFSEKFCDLELIDEKKSSASEMVYDLICNTPLKMNKEIASNIIVGIVADTGRFLFNNTTTSTFMCLAKILQKYDINLDDIYNNLYKRPFNELQLQGYMALNMKISENGVGYVKVADDVIKKYKIDTASSGNSINGFNNINEILVWISAVEDIKNGYIRVSVRSRGPAINKICERFGGGGHALASGVKLPSFLEVDDLIKELDKECLEYINKLEVSDNCEN